jgi:hypothetical protein
MRLRRHPRRAVTLIEAVLFIAVALGLIIGGLVFFQQASKSSMANQTTRLFSALLSEALAMRKENDVSSMGMALGAVLVARGAVPSSALFDGIDGSEVAECKIMAPWGGCVVMSADVYMGVTYVNLIAYGMPPEICSRVVKSDGTGNSPLAPGFFSAEIGWDGDGDFFSNVGNHANVAFHRIADHGALTPSSPGECRDNHGGRCKVPAPFCSNLTGNNNGYIYIGFRL